MDTDSIIELDQQIKKHKEFFYYNSAIFYYSYRIEENIHHICPNCKQLTQKFRCRIRELEEEIKQQKYFLQYKDIALKHRDEIISSINIENANLRKQISELQKKNDKLVDNSNDSSISILKKQTFQCIEDKLQNCQQFLKDSSLTNYVGPRSTSRKKLQSWQQQNTATQIQLDSKRNSLVSFKQKKSSSLATVINTKEKFEQMIKSKNQLQVYFQNEKKYALINQKAPNQITHFSVKKNVIRIPSQSFKATTKVTLKQGIFEEEFNVLYQYDIYSSQTSIAVIHQIIFIVDIILKENKILTEIENILSKGNDILEVLYQSDQTTRDNFIANMSSLCSDIKRFAKFTKFINIVSDQFKKQIICLELFCFCIMSTKWIQHLIELFQKFLKYYSKALIFQIDNQSNEFVSKTKIQNTYSQDHSEENLIIRIPINKGIAGHVYLTGEALRIDDAYKDSKFNPNIDLKMNFKTKTIITVPMKDANGNIIGVIQAINKINNVFDEDDVQLLQIIAKIVSVYMKNSFQFGILELNQSKLSKYIKHSFKLFNQTTFNGLVLLFQAMIKKIMNSEKCILYVKYYNKEIKKEGFLCITNENKTEWYDELYGLIGKCYKEKQKLDLPEPQKKLEYNPKIDIATHLPLLTIPVFSHNKTEVIAVFQLSNLTTQVQRSAGKINYVEYDILDFLAKQFALCFERIKEKDNLQKM